MNNIVLNKTIYSSKGALEALDEEFVQFKPKNRNKNEFFNLYDTNFYEIDNDIHKYFIGKSQEYANDYINPRERELEILNQRLQDLQFQIDSIEVVHPYFKNNIIIAKSSFKKTPEDSINNGEVYFMHSGKKRKITSSNVYYSLKNTLNPPGRDIEKTNSEFIVFIEDIAVLRILNGPPITQADQAWIPFYEINTYNRNVGKIPEFSEVNFNQDIKINDPKT